MRTQKNKDDFNKAKEAALRLLKVRIRSEQELKDRLAKKTFSTDIIEQTVNYLKDAALINDRKFAEMWINWRLAKPFGVKRIQFELKEKGINDKIIQDILYELKNNYSEDNIVDKLAKKQAAKYRSITKLRIKQRVYGYLLRKGFSSDSALKAIKQL